MPASRCPVVPCDCEASYSSARVITGLVLVKRPADEVPHLPPLVSCPSMSAASRPGTEDVSRVLAAIDISSRDVPIAGRSTPGQRASEISSRQRDGSSCRSCPVQHPALIALARRTRCRRPMPNCVTSPAVVHDVTSATRSPSARSHLSFAYAARHCRSPRQRGLLCDVKTRHTCVLSITTSWASMPCTIL